MGGSGGGGAATNQSLTQGGSSLRYNPLPVILLPLRPASLTQEQSPKMHNNSWNVSQGCKEWSTDLKTFWVEYPVRVISVAVF